MFIKIKCLGCDYNETEWSGKARQQYMSITLSVIEEPCGSAETHISSWHSVCFFWVSAMKHTQFQLASSIIYLCKTLQSQLQLQLNK